MRQRMTFYPAPYLNFPCNNEEQDNQLSPDAWVTPVLDNLFRSVLMCILGLSTEVLRWCFECILQNMHSVICNFLVCTRYTNLLLCQISYFSSLADLLSIFLLIPTGKLGSGGEVYWHIDIWHELCMVTCTCRCSDKLHFLTKVFQSTP